MRLWWPVGGVSPGLNLVDPIRSTLALVAGFGHFPEHCDWYRDEASLRPVTPLFRCFPVGVLCLPIPILRFGGVMEVPNRLLVQVLLL